MSIEPLTRETADRFADELIAMTRDSDWDDWEREHLLADRPEKWRRSLVAVRDGHPVGWAVVSATEAGAHLHHITVAPQERSSGLGTRLMTEITRQTAPGTLTLKVHPQNEAAARFYQRLGFDEQQPAPSGYRVFSRRTDTEGEST